MAEMGPRSAANIVFIVLLAGMVGFGVLSVIKFVSAAAGGAY
jgi:hypothetical protein